MSDLYILALCVIAGFVLLSRTQVAAAALFLGCIYSPIGVGFHFLDLNLPFFRFLILLALLRIFIKGEFRQITFTPVDWTVIAITSLLLVTSLFQSLKPGSGPIYISGILINTSGAYFAFRVLNSGPDFLLSLAKLMPIFLLPVAAVMILEQLNGVNYFSLVSSIGSPALMREGRIRSMGPFAHPILAGTIGAVLFPYIFLYGMPKIHAMILSAVCLIHVLTSASSGPVISLIVACLTMSLWRYRSMLQYLYLVPLCLYCLLLLIMNRAPYYLISDIDLAGGSTGWYRANLIESCIVHFREWALTGTEYTLHWIPFQHGISDQHADITNQFIVYAIMGGLSVLCAFIWLNWQVYRLASTTLALYHTDLDMTRMLFILTASLFSFISTFFSVSLFGQAQAFYWITIAFIVNVAHTINSSPKFVFREK